MANSRSKPLSKYQLAKLVKERDAAFVQAVRDDRWSPVLAYCRKYGVPLPDREIVMKAGIYKAVQECLEIPEDVKLLAREKCIALGFKPTIGDIEYG